jgi:hypothetical protein
MEKPHDFGKFTKEFAPEARKSAAQEVKKQRGLYWEKVRSLKREMYLAEEMKGSAEEIVTGVRTELSDLDEQLRERTSFLSARIRNLFEIRRIREHKAGAEERLKEAEGDLEEIVHLLSDLDERRSDKKELDLARVVAQNFYAEQLVHIPRYEAAKRERLEEEIKQEKEDQRARDVGENISRYKVFFVHGIQHLFTPKENSLLRQGIGWESKLKIALALEPTVSVSTTRPNISSDHLWSKFGVLLNGGKIEAAHPRDSASRA